MVVLKIKPEKLAVSILHSAIKGKLVEQVDGESAEIDYHDLHFTKISADISIPFDIPKTWKWVYLSDLVSKEIRRGKSPKYDENGSSFAFAQKCNSKYNGIQLNLALRISDDSLSRYSDGDEVLHNDIVINSTGTGTLGRVCIFDDKYNKTGAKYYPDSHVTVVRPIESVLAYYLYICINYYNPYFEKMGDGSTKQKELKAATIKNLLIPLPPYKEQQRIICRYKELLPYVDRYAEAYEKLEEFNAKFPEEMKKSVLQYAIEGKLVEQRAEEGTAEELYNKIKTGRKHKEINLEDLPFEIPDNWKWIRMGDIGDTNIGLTYKPADKSKEGIIVLRSSNIQNGHMDYADIVKVSCDVPERAMISKGDLLICARNGSRSLVGKSAIVDKDGMAFGAFMAKFCSPINPYVYYFLQSPLFRSQLEDVKTETINQITQDMLKNQLIPLPPLAEQRRIVAKVEELLPLCERLAECREKA